MIISDNLFFCSGQDVRDRMNRFGREGTPFFFMIDFDLSQGVAERPNALPASMLQYSFPSASNEVRQAAGCPRELRWHAFPQSFEDYRRSFDEVHHNLQSGNTFLVNLTCATPVETNWSRLNIFQQAQARYKLWLRNHFVVFSPETFVRIENGFIYSHPMKGTRDGSLPDARAGLLNDEKEAAEHATITDLIRNDLSRVAREVKVLRDRYLDELQTHEGPLLQMSSEIRGRLYENYRENLGDCLFSLLPAGSITGAPKKKTVEIIRHAETYRRGFYTGVMGFFDGCSLDSAVMIRFLEQDADGRFWFKSGGGITFKSDARNEYEEMKRKIYVPVY